MGNVVVTPIYGLCNRLQAVVSAKAIAKLLNYNFAIDGWAETDKLMGFNSIYQLINGYQFNTNDIKDYHFIEPIVVSTNPTSCDISANFQELRKHENIHIKSFLPVRLYETDSAKYATLYLESIKEMALLPEIANRINPVPLNTIGLHIRRADNQPAINNSPLELFIDIINKNLNTPIFLTTDDVDIENSLRSQYSNIFTNPKQGYHNGKVLIRTDRTYGVDDQLDKTTKLLALHEAIIDLYTLSQCKTIYGSFWSSFSIFASHINNSNLIIVKK